ncbi:MAG: flagellar assembly protein FliW [Myxococcales bacterium]|nr:flagellar assembly protein FliW [Myxococcales bacterium]
MRIDSPRFGSVEATEDQLVQFERTIPGFPGCRRFAWVDHGRETPLRWLLSVEQPEVAFLTLEPDQFLPSYDVDLPEWLLGVLEWKPTDDWNSIAFFALLTSQDGELFANLVAPIVVNLRNRRAVQWIRDEPHLPLRHPVRPLDPEARDPF